MNQAKQGSWLLLAFVLVVALFLQSITAATTHPDQMALLPLFKEGLAPFNPGWFEKPPFHTYTNYFLAVLPASTVADVLDLTSENGKLLTLVWSRLVSLALFVGAGVLFYAIVRKAFGDFSALLLTLILITSAGLISHVQFLTADIPLTAWMLAAFFFCQRILFDGRLRNYLLAGLLTGVATATKYNGLAVGLAIPVAHYLHHYYLQRREIRVAELIFPPRLVAGVAFVVLGFVLANPFSLLDYQTFIYDFVHNYKVAPVYEGQTGSSYLQFFRAVIESVGLPSFLLLAGGWLASLVLAPVGRGRTQKATVWLAAAVVALYYLKFAPFPRLETRFVLPIVPIAAIVPALALERLRIRGALSRVSAVAVVLLILAYNFACIYQVGHRFRDDPRLKATAWLSRNIPANSTVEVDIYAPAWSPMYNSPIKLVDMPFISGRERLFKQIFKNDRFVVGSPEFYARIDRLTQWYSREALAARAPDFLVINSLYYGRFLESGPRRELYPEISSFFSELLAQELGYCIVLDESSAVPPRWSYPQALDFHQNRLSVLRRCPEAVL